MNNSLNRISNFDGFEELLRKLCAFNGGWENARHLLINAHVLQTQLMQKNLEWVPHDIEKVSGSKSGQFLLEKLTSGSSEINEISVQLAYVRKYLGDFAIYGLKLQLSSKI